MPVPMLVPRHAEESIARQHATQAMHDTRTRGRGHEKGLQSGGGRPPSLHCKTIHVELRVLPLGVGTLGFRTASRPRSLAVAHGLLARAAHFGTGRASGFHNDATPAGGRRRRGDAQPASRIAWPGRTSPSHNRGRDILRSSPTEPKSFSAPAAHSLWIRGPRRGRRAAGKEGKGEGGGGALETALRNAPPRPTVPAVRGHAPRRVGLLRSAVWFAQCTNATVSACTKPCCRLSRRLPRAISEMRSRGTARRRHAASSAVAVAAARQRGGRRSSALVVACGATQAATSRSPLQGKGLLLPSQYSHSRSWR